MTEEEETAAAEKAEAEKKAAEEAAKKPPWGTDDDFNPERAWKLIEELRGDKDKLKGVNEELGGKVKQFEESTQSDQEKLEGRATTAEQRASKAETDAARLRVALKKGLDETQAKRLVGESEEDLEKDADDLLASFRSEEDDEDDAPRRPRERLRSGAARGTEPEKNDPASLAAEVSRGY